MKETYVQPEMDIMVLAIERNIMSNGENLDVNDKSGESNFWD